MPLASLLCLWFDARVPVGRRAYACSGAGLMLGKYLVDAALLWAADGRFFSPLEYLSPLWLVRGDVLEPAPAGLLMVLGLWTLPFVWIGASMSVRRAVDAGGTGWAGLFFFVPLANYAMMLWLCCAPSRRTQPAGSQVAETARRLTWVLPRLLAAVFLALGLTWISVYVVEDYGAGLFLASPFLLGLFTGCAVNWGVPRSAGTTLFATIGACALIAALLLLFALEGAVCILMAMPVAVPAAMLGALAGRLLATIGKGGASHAAAAALAVPILMGMEARIHVPRTYAVTTSIEIAASPAVVWRHVVSFSELPPPTELLFRTGIAYPVRARITGSGVGAERLCEFSTGAFVEPITAWDEPRELAFDVVSQPESMEEWSPYADLQPPHLAEHAFRSLRGRFRLAALPGGRTRLDGTTWYALDLAPAPYWRLWSDAIVHAIHGRVLRHVRTLAEADG
jgi:uncharacterized membrane protein YhaH (DUF805 family)